MDYITEEDYINLREYVKNRSKDHEYKTFLTYEEVKDILFKENLEDGAKTIVMVKLQQLSSRKILIRLNYANRFMKKQMESKLLKIG